MSQLTDKTDVGIEVTVKASVERIFAAFTKRCNEWWPKHYNLGETERTDLQLEPGVGGRWYERDADGGECDWGRVLVWDPPHHLALSWQIGIDFVPESDPERASRVDIRFIEKGPKLTTVKLVHSDFERHGKDWESMRDDVAGEGGWPGIMKDFANLKAFRTTEDEEN